MSSNRISGTIFLTRLQSTAAQPAASDSKPASKEKKMKNDVKLNKSFVMNMFRGAAVTEQAIPFPYTLTGEEKETLEMLVDPTEKFFEVRKCLEWS